MSLQKWAACAATALLVSWIDARVANANGVGHQFRVTAYGDIQAAREQGAAYRIAEPDLHAFTDEQPCLEETRRQLQSALSACGMHEAADAEPAAVEISIAIVIVERLVPAQGAFSRFRPVTHRVHDVVTLSEGADGRRIKERDRVLLPVESGYRAQTSQRTAAPVFDKSLVIAARTLGGADTTSAVTSRELWRIEVRNSDDCGQPAVYVPLMMSAALRALEQPAARTLTVVLTAADVGLQPIAADS